MEPTLTKEYKRYAPLVFRLGLEPRNAGYEPEVLPIELTKHISRHYNTIFTLLFPLS